MLEEYEINPATLAIIPIDKEKTMVYEIENEFVVNMPSMDLINDSCKYYGSSYIGRFEGTKRMTGYNYKSPIIIEETTKMIFFPTTSPRIIKCCWLALNHIDTYKEAGKSTIVIFKNGTQIMLEISLFVFESQILRATRLWSILQQKSDSLKKEKN